VSALLNNLPQYRSMMAEDLDRVMAIEQEIYAQPWTRGNFSDSLAAGYHCRIMELAGEVVGYSVLSVGAGEAHLLNLSVAARWQRRGLGREMLGFMIGLARDFLAHKIYLEVRPSNLAGRRLYAAAGFREVATRRGYYPGPGAREDAVIMELTLK
jgi:[ribosomal protein S18]-alanine N-acetyltransferase